MHCEYRAGEDAQRLEAVLQPRTPQVRGGGDVIARSADNIAEWRFH
jgi:hypothetical protein